MHKPPIVLVTRLPRTYQCVSLMETTLEAQGKSTAQDPLGRKGAEFLLSIY